MSEDGDETGDETGHDTDVNTGDDFRDAGENPGTGTDERLRELGAREGWRVDGAAARVHYSGATDRYSIEFYAPSECTLYWKVPPAEDPRETAVPVGRTTVPTPLRERIREDLAAAGIDPEVERRTL